MCEHPDVFKMRDKHGYPLNNFIGFGDTSYESPLQLKSSKRWCPLKKGEE